MTSTPNDFQQLVLLSVLLTELLVVLLACVVLSMVVFQVWRQSRFVRRDGRVEHQDEVQLRSQRARGQAGTVQV